MKLTQLIQRYRQRVDQALERCLEQQPAPAERLLEAMRYSLFNGGKRVRPVLVYATGQALDAELEHCDAAACAVELIHAYSLVHDDLPAMDDDDLRRGKPTCHKAFDEASAILAGDALQSLAFSVLAESAHPDGARLVAALAQAAGHRGMAAGQMIDIQAVGDQLNLAQLEHMHAHKTGALIRASVQLGALCAPAVDAEQLARLARYADCIGLAFQVQDDILDIEGDTATLGKQQGADQAHGKPTYPALLGLAGAKQKAWELHQQALEALADFDEKAEPLRQLSAYIVNRDY